MTDTLAQTIPADDVWTEVRDTYLAGASGAFVCREFEIAPATFWRRAAREGWRRRDQTFAAAEPPLNRDVPLQVAANARDDCWLRLMRALDQGRSTDARRWLALHQTLSAMAMADQSEAYRAAEMQASIERGRSGQGGRLDAFRAELDLLERGRGAPSGDGTP